jgi:Zn finger protein HypA/HybF involved in hydrogenase expression
MVENRWLVPTKITLDRDRRINYNGLECYSNTYMCSDCNFQYIMQVMTTSYCPNCGVEFHDIDDISI